MTDEEKLQEIFMETLGLGPGSRFRKSKRWKGKSHEQKMAYYDRRYKKLSDDEKYVLQHRGQVHNRVHREIGEYNRKRAESGKGTYGNNKHIFVRRQKDAPKSLNFDSFYREFRARYAEKPVQPRLTDVLRTEMWAGRSVRCLRDKEGRFITWRRQR